MGEVKEEADKKDEKKHKRKGSITEERKRKHERHKSKAELGIHASRSNGGNCGERSGSQPSRKQQDRSKCKRCCRQTSQFDQLQGHHCQRTTTRLTVPMEGL